MKKEAIKNMLVGLVCMLPLMMCLLGSVIIDTSEAVEPSSPEINSPTNVNTPNDFITDNESTPTPTPEATPTPLTPYEIYELASKNSNLIRNFEFEGEVNINSSFEGVTLSIPYKFDVKIINADDPDKYIMKLNYSTSLLGVGNKVSVYYKDGVSYVFTTSTYGDNEFTDKIKAEESVIPSDGKYSISDAHIFGKLMKNDFEKMVITEIENGIKYTISLTGDEARNYLKAYLNNKENDEDVVDQEYIQAPDNPLTADTYVTPDNPSDDFYTNIEEDDGEIPDDIVTPESSVTQTPLPPENKDEIINEFDKSEIDNIKISFVIDDNYNFKSFDISFDCVSQGEIFKNMNSKVNLNIQVKNLGDNVVIDEPEDLEEYK